MRDGRSTELAIRETIKLRTSEEPGDESNASRP